ncbi:MocR-like pyridoxine biosynthesis transcription factor PdxR [Mucilaginibacter ginsenosidivorans]|uniref:PLP-dependent aminotransferase family protein n=1 Tax=Mucilaginibacter ginsenosidivorans TaxID=398053 RepID=A0A5B8UVM1_9SPHI|nr:PLP-dependent aminotransferase family protein [Mucilaginibacter ginsenosidivorans]QEC62959.1 PLP-dependent aminotransferase family protein [Mucilaginibacter ginsenosidivorans]
MSIVESLICVSKESPVPVYLQIANSIISHIRRGTLKPESALPGSRTLAAALNVHRKTVVAAYDELYAQSWVDSYPRKGIFVAKSLPDITPKSLGENAPPDSFPAQTFYEVKAGLPGSRLYKPVPQHNLVINDGFPDTRLAPVELLVREYRRFGNYQFTSKYLMYGPEQGSENLRLELARFLSGTRGMHAGADNILITKGVQMAMYLTAQVLLSKNDVVIVPEPGYPTANEVFAHAGARLVFAPVDEHGMDVNAVEAICKKQKVKLLYVIPHHHRPTTVTLSSERRMQLLELAMKYSFAIIEDDYDYDYHYTSSPVLPLASADYYGSVIYVGSFCKTIAPGIRIGFVAAPQNLIAQLTRLRRMIDRQGEQLLEEAIANLLRNGDIGRHLKKTNKIYHERRDTFCNLLRERLGDNAAFKIPDGGFAVWLQYLNGLNAVAIAQKAAEMGLSVSNGEEYYYRSENNRFVRLGFASLNLKEIEQGVDILARAIGKIR